MKFKYVMMMAVLVSAIQLPSIPAAEPNGTTGEIRTNNVGPTQAYEKTNVSAWLKIDVDKDTEAVHFVRDNNDPYVVTKTYQLKYADPYEIRKYINTAVQANKVDKNPTVVDCIKFNDGTGLLLVGAEDYRFTSNKNGMSIDEIVASLDLPGLKCYTGQSTFLYFPRYWDSRSLSEIVKRVGSNITDRHTNELRYGSDKIGYDEELNCLFMYVPQYSRKNIEDMLKLYDTSTWELDIKYKLYEIDAENDGKIGADFDAWKNNAGTDFFSVGGRYRNGWNSTWSDGPNNSPYSNTQFMNFNPKWNTRYLDFLAVKGKAKVITSGDLAVMNQQTGIVAQQTNVFHPKLEKIPDQELLTYMICAPVYPATDGDGYYRISATDSTGNPITVSGDGSTITVSKVTSGTFISYYMKIVSGTAHFVSKGTSSGIQTQAFNVVVEKCSITGYKSDSTPIYTWTTQDNWNTDLGLKVYKGYKEWADVSDVDYGFKISFAPVICEDTAIMSVVLENDSLIGWNSDGSPRINNDTTVNTKVMISNKGARFVIGGLEKREVVRSISGAPYLKDIPYLGWLFSTESESTKKSQMVLVLECTPSNPDTSLGNGELSDISKINVKLQDAGEKNKWGVGQYTMSDEARYL